MTSDLPQENKGHLEVIDTKLDNIIDDVGCNKRQIAMLRDDVAKIKINQERLKAVIGFGAFLITMGLSLLGWFRS